MAHVGYALSSATPIEEVSLPHLSAALELYQASALVHDDIIDKADERRGMPTPHRTLADHHAAQSWIGSSTDFGRHSAILVGDFLFSAATAAADEQALTLPEDCARAFARRFADMHAEVALGQYLDISAEQNPLDPERTDALSMSDSLEVALHKSAHYSVVHPALLGAICAAPSFDHVAGLLDVLETILTPWGLAFQLRDDDLGVFGDPAVTGKPAGDDLREGKRTALLALTWEASSPAERRALTDVLGVAEASAQQRFAAGAGDTARFDEVFVLANFAQQFFGGEFVFGFCADVPRVGVVAELATHGAALQEGDEANAGAVDGAHRFERVDASDDR